jgi:hypothetical protein
MQQRSLEEDLGINSIGGFQAARSPHLASQARVLNMPQRYLAEDFGIKSIFLIKAVC